MANRLLNDVRVVCLNIKEGKPIIEPFKLMLSLIKEPQDIIHTHGYGGGSYIGIVGSKLARVPIIINGEHGAFFLKPNQIFIQRILTLMCTSIFSVSDSLKSKIIDNLGIRSNTIKVIPNGVDTNKFSGKHDTSYILNELKNKHDIYINNDKLIIGCIGSLKHEKNQILILKALKLLDLNIKKRVVILFIGDGPDYNSLNQYVIDNKLNKNVIFLGIRNDVHRIMSLINILVSTSTSNHEGMSNVILESLSSGKPVIATKSIGTSDLIIDGKVGFLIEQDDRKDLANKIELFIHDFEMLRIMGVNARKLIIEKYSVKRMVSNYETEYFSLLKKVSSLKKIS